MKENVFRHDFALKLQKLGWIVFEERTLVKNGKKYRADILAHHSKYKELGWFVIEAKTADGIHVVTKGHKQIVTKYINSTIQFNNEKPICFIILAPWIPQPLSPNYWESGWPYVVRIFNRYGIGVIDNKQESISFCSPDKYKIFLDPRRTGYLGYNNLPIIKNYLIKQVENL